MALQNLMATDPTGEKVDLPASGTAFVTSTPLGANGVVDSGWIKTDNFGGLLYVLRSDVPSATNGVIVEYSDDGTNPIAAGNGLTYNQVGMQIQRVLVPKGRWTRISYRNNGTPQATFRFEIKLSTALIQPTEASLNVHNSDSVLGMVVKADLEATDGNGVYDQIHRTGNGLNVYVQNPIDPTDVSDLAKSADIDNVIVALAGISNDFAPLATSEDIAGVVAAISGQSATDVSALGKEATLTDGTQKTQVTNFPAAITSLSVNNLPAIQPVSGIVGITGSVEIANDSGNPLPVSGSLSITNLPATQPVSGTLAISNFPSVQPVSGTITANVTFPATQPVSGTIAVSNLPATQPISATALPLPSGASTGTKQDTGNSSLASIDVKIPALGQKVSGSSTPVVIASDQSALAVSGFFYQATQPVSVTSLPLPTSAATSALQSTGNASLASIDSKTGVLPTGAATSAKQDTQITSLASIDAKTGTLPTGAATSAKQDVMSTTLSSIDSKVGTLPTGSATSAKQDVMIASLQGIPISSSATAISLAANGSTTIAANTARKTSNISCTSGILFVGIGFTPTATSYDYRIVSNGLVELEQKHGVQLAINFFASATSTGTITQRV